MAGGILGVLNALRHQRKNHMKDRYSVRFPASVLNALRHQRKNHVVDENGNPLEVYVLNALRHQRKNHAAERVGFDVGEDVLNALRHQRKNHWRTVLETACSILCSTPCGINGKTTAVDVTICAVWT